MTASKITVGIDGSRASQAALGWAIEEAKLRAARLCVVHTWRPPVRFPTPRAREAAVNQAEAEGRALLESAVQLIDGVPNEAMLAKSPAAPALLSLSSDAELLVVGSRGRGGFGGLLLGSVSQHCATHARCPVVIIRPTNGNIEPRVVVGVDGSVDSRTALRWAMHEAALRDLQLEVVVAWRRPWPGPHPKFDLVADAVKMSAMEALEDAIGAVVGTEMEVKRTVVEDRPALALIELAKNATLLVVGSRGMGGFAGLTLGSVSQACAHHAHGPVVIVP